MFTKLAKVLLLLAFSASPVAAKSNHYYRHHHHAHHRHYQAALPQDDLTCLANTAYREARNSDSNMQAVANVAKNRLLNGWGQSYCQVIREGRFVYSVKRPDPVQYAKAYEIAKKVMAGEVPDNTGGAIYFHASYLRHKPNWAKAQYLTARISGNVFYRDRSSVLRVANTVYEPEINQD
jgi:spore germination cell wall hydrolase CwlJ-like protein